MKETTCVEDTVFSASHPHLYKHISVFKILLSSIIALVGASAILLSSMLETTNDILSMVLLTAGVILMLVAIYRALWLSYETVYRPTGSTIRSGSLYMDSTELQHLQQMIQKNDFSSSSRLVFKEGGNGRLDYLISKDNRFVALQLFHFIPYTYESVSDKLYYTDDDAVTVARCINI